MGNVYSTPLFTQGSASNPAGIYHSSFVPADFVWVVRDMVFVNVPAANTPTLAMSGFQVYDNEGAPLWTVLNPYSQAGSTYHWSGHQVLDTEDRLNVNVGDAGWTWRISGYTLSLP